MPGPVIPVGLAQVLVEWSLLGDADPLVVTYGINASVPYDVTLANAIHTIWTNRMRPQMPAVYTFTKVDLWVQVSAGARNVVSSTNAPLNGTAGGSALPQNCAAIVSKQTALGGRRNRGRMFIPGAIEANIDQAGVWGVAALAAYQTAITNVFNDHVVANAPMQLFHAEAPFDSTPIAALVARNRIGTVRRRLRR